MAARIARPPETTPNAILQYWFQTLSRRDWYAKNASLDNDIARRFGDTLAAAARCELWRWRDSDNGRLAEIIVVDQFSRNIHRDTPAAFANDPLALALAQEAVARGADASLASAQKAFLYMPYMHSESETIHTQALALFGQAGLEDNLEHAKRHYAIIERFGRYPHRNAIVGRTSTPEEIEFLKQPGSSF